jgi:hypothetical protein
MDMITKNTTKVKEKIAGIEPTDEKLTARAGLTVFNRFVSKINFFKIIEERFNYLRRSKKGLPVSEIFKQVINYFVEGTSFSLSRFDDLKEDETYKALIETSVDNMLSSHQAKRFFYKFEKREREKLSELLRALFIWRLQVESPEIIILNIDTMVMDNNDAKKREGVEYTYKNIKGYQPLQMTWEGFIIDAEFRSGSKHSNYDHQAIRMIKRMVKKIRKEYKKDIPILIRFDSGFYDIVNYTELDKLNVGFISAGKMYDDIKEYASCVDSKNINEFHNEDNTWDYFEFGNTRGTWNGKFYRSFYLELMPKSEQLILDFIKKKKVLYTNIGIDEKFTGLLKESNNIKYLKAETIIESYHQRGTDELVNRALKDFGTEQLPFQKFNHNAGFYFMMLISFFLYQTFKIDVTINVINISSYASTFRRKIIDIAGKIIKTGGIITLKILRSVYNRIKIQELWALANSPPYIFSY